MRTTLNIDDDVMAAAVELARRQRKPLGQVISDLARVGLSAGGPGASEPAPSALLGFSPLPARGIAVSDATVERLRDQEGV